MKESQVIYQTAQMAVTLGMTILAGGGETFRAEDTIERVLKAGGCREVQVNAFSTHVTASFLSPDGEHICLTRRIKTRTIHLGQIHNANTLSRKFCAGKISLEEACAEARHLQETPAYAPWVLVLFTVLTPIFFTILLGGSLLDCLFAGVNGCLLAFGEWGKKRVRLYGAAYNFFMGVLLAFAGHGYTSLPGIALHLDIMLPGSIMALLPGVTLTNGVQDMLHEDYMSGSARMVEAVITASTLAVGIGFGLSLANSVFGGAL